MSEFSVTTVRLSKETDVWGSVARELQSKNERLRSIYTSLSITGSSAGNIKEYLMTVSRHLEEMEKDSTAIKQALADIAACYEKTESRLIKGILKKTSVNSQKGKQVVPDYDYAKEVQKILDKLNGKDVNTVDQLKYFYDLLQKASFTDPENCTLTKAEKEALLRFLGPVLDQAGKAGIGMVGYSEEFFSEEVVSKLCNGKVFNEAEKAVIGAIAGPLAQCLGFVYNEETDSYYTKEGCLQQQWGFCDAIDDWGPGLGMDLDTDVVTFKYDGQEFRVQLWKGVYGGGFSVGSEFAIYSRSEAEAMANPYEWGSENSRYILYDSVEQKYQPTVKQKTEYTDAEGKSHAFSCDTRDYGDGDDFWNLNIRTDAGVEKNSIGTTFTIDCSKQGEGFAQAFTEAFKRDSNLAKEPILDGTVITLEYKSQE